MALGCFEPTTIDGSYPGEPSLELPSEKKETRDESAQKRFSDEQLPERHCRFWRQEMPVAASFQYFRAIGDVHGA
jgi:hypothetical protein